MCNLNILISKKNHKDSFKMIIPFMQSVTSASYSFNNYADGVYFNNTNAIYKDSDKLNFMNFEKDIKKSNIIITHQRLATHGLNTLSNQPFLIDGFVFVHNGILNEYGLLNKEKSDSLNMFETFITMFNEKIKNTLNKDTYRESIILECIKQCIELKDGSFSIFLLDVKTQNMYYFKNNMTDINFYRGKDYIFITTRENNKEFLTLLEQKFNKIKIKNNSIYKLFLDKNNIMCHKIGKIKHLTYFTTNKTDKNTYQDVKTFNNFGFYGRNSTSEDYIKNNDCYLTNKYPCKYCKRLTNNFDIIEKDLICEECLNFERKYT